MRYLAKIHLSTDAMGVWVRADVAEQRLLAKLLCHVVETVSQS